MKTMKKLTAVIAALVLMLLPLTTTAEALDFSASHTHSYFMILQRTPNCNRTGYSLGICRKCLRISFSKYGKTEHEWAIEEVAPSCTANGNEKRSCRLCGTTVNTTLSATGHSYSEWTAEGDREVRVCTVCGDKQYRNPTTPTTPTETPGRGDVADRESITTGVSVNAAVTVTDYVTPEQFGAYADGTHDDAAAIQAAVDSGKNVVFTAGKTYYMAPESYVSINNKSGFIMSGGTIHKAASDTNINCFVITGCTDCVFQNMYIYSEFTATDRLTPADHTRPTGYSSNVLAFSGWNNTGIKFINNRFDRMDADYWFNANAAKGEWKNILVDGWISSTTIMPLYCQYIEGLEICNARVSMSETHSGDGDHILYICRMSRTVRVHDCYFSSKAGASRAVLLTIHGISATADSCPQDVRFTNCTIDAGPDRALYSGNGASVEFINCTLTNNPTQDNMYLVTGDKSNQFHFTDCVLVSDGPVYCIGETKIVTLDNCLIRATGTGVFAGPFNVTVNGCDIEIEGGSLCFSNYSDGFDYTFIDTTVNKTGTGTYIASIRKTGGKLSFKGCTLNCPSTTYFMYNAGVDMSAVSFENTSITVARALANSSEAKGYSAVNSYLNGNLI